MTRRSSSLAILTCLAFTSRPAQPAGWSTFGDEDQLPGYSISAAGVLHRFTFVQNEYAEYIYLLGGICFSVVNEHSPIRLEDKAALLLINQQRDVKVAIFDTSIASIEVKIRAVRLADCGQVMGRQTEDVIQENYRELERMNRRQEELEKQLEELNRSK